MTRIDLILVQSDTFRARLSVLQNGEAVDLTGYTIGLIIKRDPFVADADADLELIDEDGLDIDDEAGEIDFTITDELAEDLSTAFPFFWRLLLIDPIGAKFTPCGGDLVLEAFGAAPSAITYSDAVLAQYTATIGLITSAAEGEMVGEGGESMSGEGGETLVAEGT